MRSWLLLGFAAATAACGSFLGVSSDTEPAPAPAPAPDAAPDPRASLGPGDPRGPARDLAMGQQTPGPIVVDPTSVYWINQASGGKPGTLMKLAKAGGDPITLMPDLADPYALTADATRLYISANNNGPNFSFQNLWLQDKTGGEAKRLQLDANDQVFGCSTQGSEVFWVLMTNGGQVGFVETDTWTTTSAVFPIAKDLGAVKNIVATPSDVFVGGAGELLQVTRVGAVKTVFATTAGPVKALVLDAPASTLYWADTASIQRRTIGSVDGPVTLASNQNGPSAIAIDATNVYWTNAGDGTVQRVAKAGGPPTTMSTGELEPLGIAVDETGVYWTNRGDGRVRFYPR